MDVAAKVLADDLTSLVGATAQAKRQDDVPLAGALRRCMRKFAALVMLRMLPPVLLLVGDVIATIDNTVALLARSDATGRARALHPTTDSPDRPHARYAYN